MVERKAMQLQTLQSVSSVSTSIHHGSLTKPLDSAESEFDQAFLDELFVCSPQRCTGFDDDIPLPKVLPTPPGLCLPPLPAMAQPRPCMPPIPALEVSVKHQEDTFWDYFETTPTPSEQDPTSPEGKFTSPKYKERNRTAQRRFRDRKKNEVEVHKSCYVNLLKHAWDLCAIHGDLLSHVENSLSRAFINHEDIAAILKDTKKGFVNLEASVKSLKINDDLYKQAAIGNGRKKPLPLPCDCGHESINLKTLHHVMSLRRQLMDGCMPRPMLGFPYEAGTHGSSQWYKPNP